MSIDDRQPPGRPMDGQHERLGLREPHGVARVAFVRLEVERHQGLRSRLGERQEGRRLLFARILARAEMVAAPQQACLRPTAPRGVAGIDESPPSVALWITPRMLLLRTRLKSLTRTLWLMSITASRPALAGYPSALLPEEYDRGLFARTCRHGGQGGRSCEYGPARNHSVQLIRQCAQGKIAGSLKKSGTTALRWTCAFQAIGWFGEVFGGAHPHG